MIHLLKTNSEGRQAQLDILSEDFQPIKSILPHPIIGLLGLKNLDVEGTSDMIMKMSISGLIKTDLNIDLVRLINHQNGFMYRSCAVNTEFLTRVRNKKGIFAMESMLTLEKFLAKTNPYPRFNYTENPYSLDDFLLGNTGWREASPNILRPRL